MPWTKYPDSEPPPVKLTKDGKSWGWWRKTAPDTPEQERKRAWNRAYMARNKEQRRRYAEAYQRRHAERLRTNAQVLRARVLRHYCGGAEPSCACCGETILGFLTFDHIQNDGHLHRQSVGRRGALYRWLIARGLPEGFQVLCFNCNLGRAFAPEHRCPHLLVHDRV